MTKRRDILKKFRKGAKAAHVEIEEREGANHTLLIFEGLRVPVPRHNEIPDRDAQNIFKEAEPKLGKDWWK